MQSTSHGVKIFKYWLYDIDLKININYLKVHFLVAVTSPQLHRELEYVYYHRNMINFIVFLTCNWFEIGKQDITGPLFPLALFTISS